MYHIPIPYIAKTVKRSPRHRLSGFSLLLLLAVFPAAAQDAWPGAADAAMDGVASMLSAAGRRGEVSQSETSNPSGATDGAGWAGQFFIGASAATALYSNNAAAFGGGLAAGYGFDIGAVGVALDYLVDPDGLTTFAPGLFVRFYLPLPFINAEPPFRSGPFLQFTLGPSFHTSDPRLPPAVVAGSVSAGLAAGWRFLGGNRWYVEPTLRGGYPFITGAGIAAGCLF